MSKLYIVMYHYIRDLSHSRYPGIKGLDIKQFERQINFIKENFTVITMEAVMDGNIPPNAALLTFDDGYIDHYDYVFPILEEAKLQGSFFIPGKTFSEHELLDVNKIHYILACADIKNLLADLFEHMDFYRGMEYTYQANKDLFYQHAKKSRFDTKETVFVKQMLQAVLPEQVRNLISSELFEKYVGVTPKQMAYELYMSEKQIRMMKRHGMFIGVHGYDHYWLGRVSSRQMRQDISKALEAMDEFIDRRHWVMNYPYGDYNDNVLNVIKEQGACLGLTTRIAAADLSRGGVNGRYKLPRLDCNDLPPKSSNYKVLK